MASPFPGIDPYIENAGAWGDFHHRIIAGLREALDRRVPERYVVRIEVRVYIDIILLPARIEREFREYFLQIRKADSGKIVTVVEFLSPSNKRADAKGYRLYNRKREAYSLGKVNLVEIDLLRGGKRPRMAKPWPPSDYYVMVARAGKWRKCEIWPFSLPQPIPPVAIPLTGEDPDIELEIQPMVDRAYEEGRYHHTLRYDQSLRPLPNADTADWIETILAR